MIESKLSRFAKRTRSEKRYTFTRQRAQACAFLLFLLALSVFSWSHKQIRNDKNWNAIVTEMEEEDRSIMGIDLDAYMLDPKVSSSNTKLIDHHNMLPRVLAFVFPQFHEDSLNNYLWGKGFTDWDNLRNSPQQNKVGLKIPRPTELGYYDYRDLDPRKKQGELAKQYGIDGFVYHHYWFYDETHPGPNLHQPLENMLQDGHPDVPFALHWCASKWTHNW